MLNYLEFHTEFLSHLEGRFPNRKFPWNRESIVKSASESIENRKLSDREKYRSILLAAAVVFEIHAEKILGGPSPTLAIKPSHFGQSPSLFHDTLVRLFPSGS